MLFTEAAFSFFDSTFSAVAIVVSFCPRRSVFSGRYLSLMHAPMKRVLILLFGRWVRVDADKGKSRVCTLPRMRGPDRDWFHQPLTLPIHQWRAPPAAHRSPSRQNASSARWTAWCQTSP